MKMENDSTNEPDEIEYVVPGAAVTALRSALLEANHLFQSETTGGRVGVVKAIAAVTEFLYCFDILKDDALLAPLVVLNSALGGLDKGSVQELFGLGTSDSNRPPAGNMRLTTQALAVFASDSLKGLGLSRSEADKRVADVLYNHGVGSKGSSNPPSAETVRGWREIASHGKRNPRLSSIVWDFKKSGVEKVWQGKPEEQTIEVVLAILGVLIDRYRADAAD